jgi:hypothetical protein
MKVIIIAPPLFYNRPERHIMDSIVNFVKDKVKYSYISTGIYDDVYNGYNIDYTLRFDDFLMERVYLRSIENVIEQISQNDILIWGDIWWPAISSIFHFCAANRLNVKHYGIFHDFPFRKRAYLEGNKWAYSHFKGTILNNTVKAIFTATCSAKKDIEKNLCLDNLHKIKVTGLPINHIPKQNCKKENIIMFNNRFSFDRNSEKFIALNQKLKLDFMLLTSSKYIYNKYINTNLKVELHENRKEYFKILKKCKFVWSDSIAESFGYAIAEAYLSGAIPILNDIPCYRELYPNSIYTSFNEMVDMIKTANYEDVIFNYEDHAIENMFNIINQDTGILTKGI